MLDGLQSLDVWLFRFGNITLSNSFFDTVMPVITSNSYVLPVLLAYVVGVLWRGTVRDQIFILLVIAAIAIADQSVTLWKDLFLRPRPCHSFTDIHLLVPCGTGKSFPSGHATNNFAGAMLAALCYGRWGKVVFVWAVVASFSRVYCGVHYPLDLLGGALWGSLVGWLVFWLYRRIVPTTSSIAL